MPSETIPAILVLFVILAIILAGLNIIFRHLARSANQEINSLLPSGNGSSANSSNVYDDLRKAALNTTANDLHLDNIELNMPYGAVMEFRVSNSHIVTLTSFVTGDASIYISTGGGIIGGIQNENVNASAQVFVATSQSYLDKMQKTAVYPSPSDGMVRFFVMTNQGVFTQEIPEKQLQSGISTFTTLYLTAQNVITSFRLSEPKQN